MMSAWVLALLVLAPARAQDDQGKPNEPDVIEPGGGDRLWVFAESPEELGSGGEFHIYVDPETHPEAKASFAKFSLGPGGALPVHRHDKTEEISYFVSGTGLVQTMENGELVEVPVAEGHVWYVPPGAWHAIRNTGEVPLTLVFATIPNEKQGLLSFFRRIGAQPGHEPTPLAPEEFAGLAAEHDLILRPPEPPED
jgi:mannose-6-phosphate isomerase-like protein (cupin superfamily)